MNCLEIFIFLLIHVKHKIIIYYLSESYKLKYNFQLVRFVSEIISEKKSNKSYKTVGCGTFSHSGLCLNERIWTICFDYISSDMKTCGFRIAKAAGNDATNSFLNRLVIFNKSTSSYTRTYSVLLLKSSSSIDRIPYHCTTPAVEATRPYSGGLFDD